MIECINRSILTKHQFQNFDQTLPTAVAVDFFIPFAFTGGASRKGEGLSKQLVVTEDEDVVYHKLPGGKRKRTTVVHDLMAAVNSGKRPAKKH